MTGHRFFCHSLKGSLNRADCAKTIANTYNSFSQSVYDWLEVKKVYVAKERLLVLNLCVFVTKSVH